MMDVVYVISKETQPNEESQNKDVTGVRTEGVTLDLSGFYTTIPGEKTGILVPIKDASIAGNQAEQKKQSQSWPCDVCGKIFSKQKYLKRHYSAHVVDKQLKCPHCEKRFADPSSFTRHKKSHAGNRPYECSVCQKTFSQTSHLSVHMRTVHSNIKPFTCEYCSNSFGRIHQLRCHLRTHTGEKPFQCEECQRTFTSASSLTVHKRSHTGEKPYKCKICEKTFVDSSALKHHGRLHSGEKPFQCDICQESFSRQWSLKMHKVKHEKNLLVPMQAEKQKPDIVVELPLKCPNCEKQFSHVSNLRRHLRTHSGEKPYICKVCSKTFTQSTHLKTHMSVHATKIKFSCPNCLKGFDNATSLRKHLLTHCEKNPSTCSVCGLKFPCSGSPKHTGTSSSTTKSLLCTNCQKSLSDKKGKTNNCPKCNAAFEMDWYLKIHMETCSSTPVNAVSESQSPGKVEDENNVLTSASETDQQISKAGEISAETNQHICNGGDISKETNQQICIPVNIEIETKQQTPNIGRVANQQNSQGDEISMETNQQISKRVHVEAATNQPVSKAVHVAKEQISETDTNQYISKDGCMTTGTISKADGILMETNQQLSEADGILMETNQQLSEADGILMETNQQVSEADVILMKTNQQIPEDFAAETNQQLTISPEIDNQIVPLRSNFPRTMSPYGEVHSHQSSNLFIGPQSGELSFIIELPQKAELGMSCTPFNIELPQKAELGMSSAAINIELPQKAELGMSCTPINIELPQKAELGMSCTPINIELPQKAELGMSCSPINIGLPQKAELGMSSAAINSEMAFNKGPIVGVAPLVTQGSNFVADKSSCVYEAFGCSKTSQATYLISKQSGVNQSSTSCVSEEDALFSQNFLAPLSHSSQSDSIKFSDVLKNDELISMSRRSPLLLDVSEINLMYSPLKAVPTGHSNIGSRADELGSNCFPNSDSRGEMTSSLTESTDLIHRSGTHDDLTNGMGINDSLNQQGIDCDTAPYCSSETISPDFSTDSALGLSEIDALVNFPPSSGANNFLSSFSESRPDTITHISENWNSDLIDNVSFNSQLKDMPRESIIKGGSVFDSVRDSSLESESLELSCDANYEILNSVVCPLEKGRIDEDINNCDIFCDNNLQQTTTTTLRRSKRNKDNNRNKVDNKPFKCSKCDKSFILGLLLQIHQESAHVQRKSDKK